MTALERTLRMYTLIAHVYYATNEGGFHGACRSTRKEEE